MKHVEAELKVYLTDKYGEFRFLKGNRDIDEKKVKSIIESIDSGINFLRYAPIVVNEKMEIIDGQHRFYVSKKIGSPIFYVIMNDSDLNIVPEINNNQSKWRLKDFFNSYLDLKKPEYVALNEFCQKWSRMSLTTAINLLAKNQKTAKEDFMKGKFTMARKSHVEEICNYLEDFEPYCKNPYTNRWFKAIEMLVVPDNEKYNHKTMVKKLSEADKVVENYSNSKDILFELEAIYNHRMRTRVTIY